MMLPHSLVMTVALASAAHASPNERLAAAVPAAERLTGYVVGGISPLGQKKRLRTFVDASSARLDEIHVSGGRRGVEIALAPTALVELLGATVGPLVAEPVSREQ